MKIFLPLLAAPLLLASCAGGPGISRDGANDEANVDSSAPAPTSADMGEESRNVDFRTPTDSLPAEQHPGSYRNANGVVTDPGTADDANKSR